VLGRLALAVVTSLLTFAAAAHAQTSDTRNRALIVLDASKSMNEDAGNGGTRLDAAKRAVDSLVDRLPEGAPLGLRVYGSKVSEVSRAEGCRDTELTVPVGPLDKQALRGTVSALTGKGRTPIGSSLLAVPGDLGPSEGRRSVVLVTDGGDNCAPPDPCKAAERVARRGVEMSISVVGFQVNDRVRRQLRCIAEAGGGSYVDVGDADKLGDELAALLSRAFRSYEASGTKVAGAPEADQAPSLGAGLFLDSAADEQWHRYAIDVPAGRRAIVSATAIPPVGSEGTGALDLQLGDRAGNVIGGDTRLLQGASGLNIGAGTVSATVRSRRQDPPGRYIVSVQVTGDYGGEVPVEIGIQFLRPGETVGLVRAPGALGAPTPSPTPRARATAAPPASEDSSGLGGWLVVAAIGVAAVAVGLTAATVLGRKAAA
jgi:Ca-activated chloride channel family protein